METTLFDTPSARPEVREPGTEDAQGGQRRGGRAPAGLVLREENETLHVDLSPEQRASLERGGIVQIDHRLVEPRDHTLTVAFTGEEWEGDEVAALEVASPRDRLTFLELDLAALEPGKPAGHLAAKVWQR